MWFWVHGALEGLLNNQLVAKFMLWLLQRFCCVSSYPVVNSNRQFHIV